VDGLRDADVLSPKIGRALRFSLASGSPSPLLDARARRGMGARGSGAGAKCLRWRPSWGTAVARTGWADARAGARARVRGPRGRRRCRAGRGQCGTAAGRGKTRVWGSRFAFAVPNMGVLCVHGLDISLSLDQI